MTNMLSMEKASSGFVACRRHKFKVNLKKDTQHKQHITRKHE